MEIFKYLTLFSFHLAVGLCQENLQREIEDYLRDFAEYQGKIPRVLESLPPYPSLRLNKFTPPNNDFSQPDSLLTSEKLSSDLQPHKLAPKGSSKNAMAYVQLKQPESSESVQINTKAVAFASVQDVQNEEHLGENQQIYTSKEPEKKSPQLLQQTHGVSEIMARKGDDLEVISASENFNDVYFVAIVAGCCAAGIFGVISAGFCFYKLQKNNKAAADVDYPAYGVTGPNKDTTPPNGDRKLAQSAQMYHYQHQKQQMIAVEKAGSVKNTSASDVDTEEENEEGEYTVYECPGLAPTGEMEVKNPLFNDDSTPISPPVSTIKPEEMPPK